jgi:hypothetical protein
MAWTVKKHELTRRDLTWAVAYYQTVIEDIARTKRRRVEILYYTLLLFGGLFAFLETLRGADLVSKPLSVFVVLLAVAIYLAAAFIVAGFGDELRRFRAISYRFHTEVFPPIVRAVRHGIDLRIAEIDTSNLEPDKVKQDLPWVILLYVVPAGGPVLIGWFVALVFF